MNSRLARLLAAITCAVAAALPAAPALAAATGTCQSWSGAQPPSPGTDDNQLNSVAVLSPCNAWAVGSFESGARQTLIEHWNGGAWTVAKSPEPGTNDRVLYGVTAVSATNVWAVGTYVDGSVGKTLIAHWNGHTWAKVPSPNPSPDNNALLSVSASSANNAWAVGTFGNGTVDKTLTVHWNGRTWTKVTSPDPGQKNAKVVLNSVAVTSATNAWAVGEVDTPTAVQALILHWNGRSWTKVAAPSPAPNATFLPSVAATSASNAWVVGAFERGRINRTLILHWDGRSWKQESSPNPGGATARDTLASVTALSAGAAWAVGSYVKGNSDDGTVVLLHWTGRAWKSVTGPRPGIDNELFSVAASSASNIWAVGDFSAGGSDQTLAFHCC